MPLHSGVFVVAIACGISGGSGAPERRNVRTAPGNMNTGVRYTIANPLTGHEGQAQNFTGDFFEVYTPPLRSRYSEVFWQQLPAVSIPEAIRTRYHNKIMAVTGWEVDVVRKTPSGDVSVPCFESYNHHYTAELLGAKARLSAKKGPDHGHGPTNLFDVEEGPEWIPQVQAFNEHNGNEARQSFRGLPRGYVQPIESPSTFLMFPMQINTRNPDGSGTRGGPLPKASKAPPNASYSGLVECPCSTRRKKVLGAAVSRTSGSCGDPSDHRDAWEPSTHSTHAGELPVDTADACFAAAATLFGKGASKNVTVSNASLPSKCFILPDSAAAYETVFNTDQSSQATCGSHGATCVCLQKGGTIDGFSWNPPCAAWPASDLAKNHNPSCELSTYAGGIACCRGGNFLLDEDQEIPDHIDEVFYKWRIYFEDWDPKVHIQAVHLEWALNGCDSGGGHKACSVIDYDVPMAPAGTPPAEAVHTVTSHFKASDMFTACNARSATYCADPKNVTAAGVQLIMAGGHCHAPACLSLELWNEDTGELLCQVTPALGSGDEAQNEKGYLWLPHCAWGEAAYGLKPPPIIHLDTKLRSSKRTNSTYYHPGVMAIWQMRGAFATAPVYV